MEYIYEPKRFITDVDSFLKIEAKPNIEQTINESLKQYFAVKAQLNFQVELSKISNGEKVTI